MKETSMSAYREIVESGQDMNQRDQIVNLLSKSGHLLTGREIGKELNFEAWRRMSELVKVGRVVEHGERQCSVTGKVATTYRIATEDDEKPEIVKEPTRQELMDLLRKARPVLTATTILVESASGPQANKDAILRELEPLTDKISAILDKEPANARA